MPPRARALIVAHAVLASAAAAAGQSASPGNELAEAMIDAYQAVESYHARWLMLDGDGVGRARRYEVEIAFERGSGRLLVRRQGSGRTGELLICDGREVVVARRPDEYAPVTTMHIDPDAITWWVMERSLTFQPIDLPLLLGEPPLLGWLHVTGGAIDCNSLREFSITGPAGGGAVSARLDAANFISEATQAQSSSTFVLTSLAVDEPLDWATFDFDAQSAFLGAP